MLGHTHMGMVQKRFLRQIQCVLTLLLRKLAFRLDKPAGLVI